MHFKPILTLKSKSFTDKAPTKVSALQFHLVHSSYIYCYAQKHSWYDTVNPWEIYFYLLMYLSFFVVFLHYQWWTYSEVFFKEFVFACTIPFTFPEIMKALVLVEHISTTGF